MLARSSSATAAHDLLRVAGLQAGAAQVEDGGPDLVADALQLLQHGARCAPAALRRWLQCGARLVQVQAGGVDRLDDAVVQVAPDALTLARQQLPAAGLGQGAIRLLLEQVQRPG